MLCLALLAGIVAEDRTHLKPTDVEPYHAKARTVIEEWPKTIPDREGDRIGEWTTSTDESLPPSAEQLLHPNAKIDRRYTSNLLAPNGLPVQASLLIVQCKDSRDMAGHYPPICYPAAGEERISEPLPFNLYVNGMWINGTEYHFLQKTLPVSRQCVYDFFIVPGQGFKSDMPDVRKAAGDYQRRYYGAAQFQVVMDADYPQEFRERIFREIIGANSGALSVLNTVEVQ
jgi:hypothetical protein